MTDIDEGLLTEFIGSTHEHLDDIEAMLVALGENPDSVEIINDLFKHFHSIKGSSQFIGLENTSVLSHRMEDLLDLLRQDKLQVNTAIMDVFMDGRDRLLALLDELEQTGEEHSPVEDILVKLTALITGDVEDDGAGEDMDQELYEIFINNLQDRITQIKLLTLRCEAGDDPVKQMEHCNTAVSNLISSANYMSYDKVASKFASWKDEIEATLSQLSSGQAVSFDFMHRQLDDILQIYPQIAPAVMMADESFEVDDISPVVDAAVEEVEVTTQTSDDSPVVQREEIEEEEEDDDVDLDLLDDFITEAAEHLEEIEALLLSLSTDMNNIDLLNDIFRPIHTIKGGAQFIGLSRIAKLSHRMEDLLDLMRRGERDSSELIVDTLIDGRDRINTLVMELVESQRETSPVNDLVKQLSEMIDGVAAPSAESAVVEQIEVEQPVVEEIVMSGSTVIETGDGYEEESDKELFGIFIDQMSKKTAALMSKLDDLSIASDPAPGLAQCRKDIADLKSSANYMGYENLNSFYQSWLQEVDNANNALQSGNKITFDFMSNRINELSSMFPQIQQAVEQPVEIVSTAVVQSDMSDSDSDSASAEEAALMDKLSSALDSAMGSSTEDQHVETLHDVFEEMLSGKEVDTRAALNAVKQDIAPKYEEEAEPEVVEPELPERREAGDDRRTGNITNAGDRREEDRRTGDRVYKKSIRVDAEKIDTLMNQVGELVVDRSFFFQLFNEMKIMQTNMKETLGTDKREFKDLREFTYRMGEAIASFGRTTNDLQEGVMRVRMLPISQLFNRYPRLLRDLTHNTDKQVKLEVFGEETELDKMVVEELADPLIHVIRNAVDHGLEGVEERKAAGKSEKGTLVLEAFQEGNNIVIEVTDDGRGIDPEKIKSIALNKGLRTQEELDGMLDEDAIKLIMEAGFSTAEKITGTSGRGVGMDVVKTNVEKMNGTLEIDSEIGKFTQMRMKIPLTLAIIPALMIRVGEAMFTIPLANVEETLHINISDTTTIEGTEVMQLRGQTLPIFYLTDLFNLESQASEMGDEDTAFVVVVNSGDHQIGFAVDELLGQEEVVIKPLADYLQEKSGFSGATIIGDGRISLILDVYSLVKLTADRQVNRQKRLSAKRRELGANKKQYEQPGASA